MLPVTVTSHSLLSQLPDVTSASTWIVEYARVDSVQVAVHFMPRDVRSTEMLPLIGLSFVIRSSTARSSSPVAIRVQVPVRSGSEGESPITWFNACWACHQLNTQIPAPRTAQAAMTASRMTMALNRVRLSSLGWGGGYAISSSLGLVCRNVALDVLVSADSGLVAARTDVSVASADPEAIPSRCGNLPTTG